MNTLAKLGSVLAAGALSLGALAAAAPAQAAPAAPDCVKVDHWVGRVSQTVKVTNQCTGRISFQVKRVGPDSPCFLVAGSRNAWRTYQWARYASFQGIRWNCT